MFFLMRAAFWLTIVLALLPTGSKHTSVQGPQIGEAISAAGAAVSDARHFCDRQREACAIGSLVATMIAQRAQAGAKMLYELISEHSGPAETGSIAKTEPGSKSPETPPLPVERGTIMAGSERR